MATPTPEQMADPEFQRMFREAVRNFNHSPESYVQGWLPRSWIVSRPKSAPEEDKTNG